MSVIAAAGHYIRRLRRVRSTNLLAHECLLFVLAINWILCFMRQRMRRQLQQLTTTTSEHIS